MSFMKRLKHPKTVTHIRKSKMVLAGLMDYCIVTATAVQNAVVRTCSSNNVLGKLTDLALRQNFSWFRVTTLLFLWNTAFYGCFVVDFVVPGKVIFTLCYQILF